MNELTHLQGIMNQLSVGGKASRRSLEALEPRVQNWRMLDELIGVVLCLERQLSRLLASLITSVVFEEVSDTVRGHVHSDDLAIRL